VLGAALLGARAACPGIRTGGCVRAVCAERRPDALLPGCGCCPLGHASVRVFSHHIGVARAAGHQPICMSEAYLKPAPQQCLLLEPCRVVAHAHAGARLRTVLGLFVQPMKKLCLQCWW